MIITKILECKYKVLLAVDKPFSKFGVYRKNREHLGFPVERRCFNCDHEFLTMTKIFILSMLKILITVLFVKNVII